MFENAFLSHDPIEKKLIGKKRITVKADHAFYSDHGRIKVIIFNLIENAIKYSKKIHKVSFIKVRAHISTKKLKLEIEDNGIGIESEYLPEIFQMFYRATTDAHGSGLGLYIVKECIEKLNGKIQVESKMNIGTKFIIEIPNTK